MKQDEGYTSEKHYRSQQIADKYRKSAAKRAGRVTGGNSVSGLGVSRRKTRKKSITPADILADLLSDRRVVIAAAIIAALLLIFIFTRIFGGGRKPVETEPETTTTEAPVETTTEEETTAPEDEEETTEAEGSFVEKLKELRYSDGMVRNVIIVSAVIVLVVVVAIVIRKRSKKVL